MKVLTSHSNKTALFCSSAMYQSYALHPILLNEFRKCKSVFFLHYFSGNKQKIRHNVNIVRNKDPKRKKKRVLPEGGEEERGNDGRVWERWKKKSWLKLKRLIRSCTILTTDTRLLSALVLCSVLALLNLQCRLH